MEAKITRFAVEVYTIPTDAPEADGTFSWNKTTMVVADCGMARRAHSDTPMRMQLLGKLSMTCCRTN